MSDYGTQLREKQRLRKMFGMQEAQFHLFFERAQSARGVTGEKLLQALEMRLDNLVYRLGDFRRHRLDRRILLRPEMAQLSRGL